MKRRISALLLSVVLCLGMLSTTAFAADVTVTGTVGGTSITIKATGLSDGEYTCALWNDAAHGELLFLFTATAEQLANHTISVSKALQESDFGAMNVAIQGLDATIPLTKDGTVTPPPVTTTYTVTFDALGGAVTPASAVTGTDGRLSGLPTPIRDGYTFDGWFTAADGGVQVTADRVYTANTTIYAHWTPVPVTTTYTITFNANGGTVTPASLTTGTDGRLPYLPAASRPGYFFNGWFLADGTPLAADHVFAADETVTARWTYMGGGDPVGPVTPVTPVTPNPGGTAPSRPSTDPEKPGETPETPDTPDTPAEPSEPSTPAVRMPFTDVTPGDWYASAVQYVYQNGMMNGTAATTFSPNATTTRGMIVTILYRLEGEPAAGASAFTDVPAGQWYTNAVAWAAANGIVGGYGDGKFGPGDTITREQMAAILYRYAAYKGCSTAGRADLSAYTDAGQISPYALEPMQWANGEGLITGVTATTLVPAGSATRAQVAAILMRFCENIAK